MTKKHAPAAAGELTQEELAEFLLWFFTHTGHAEHVRTWRASREHQGNASTERDPATDP